MDFHWQIKTAVEECLESLSKAGFEREWYGDNPDYAHIYNHTQNLLLEGKGQSGIDKGISIIDSIYDKYDADALSRWNIYPDTLDMLEELKRMGFKMGVISNIGSKSLRTAMDRLDLSNRITVVISRNDVKQLKPNPEGLLKAAAAFSVDPAQCIFIGDSLNDVGAARKAGMLSGYLVGGQDSPETMAYDPADIKIQRLNQLPGRLSRIE